MPSVRHEAPLELIRQCPPVAAELFRAITRDDEARLLPEKLKAGLGPNDFSEIVPVTFLADSVVVVSDAVTAKPVLAIDMTENNGARHVLTAINDTGASDADRIA